MRRKRRPSTAPKIALALLGLAILGVLLYQIPSVRQDLSWRIDLVLTRLRGQIDPVEAMPTPVGQATLQPSPSPTIPPTLPPDQPTPAPLPTQTPPPTPTPLPEQVTLPGPAYEPQGMNKCGPATLAMYLRYYGWEGDQDDIAQVIKPVDKDRNVNVEELAYYVRNYAGWLNVTYRVGGDLHLLKTLLAQGFPVMIEESTPLDQSYWENDDRWAGHYLLITGYDEARGIFFVLDSYKPHVTSVSYAEVTQNWQAFNYVYIIVYLPGQEGRLAAALGDQWDEAANRQHALALAQSETESQPENAFAWFNLGTNLVYFERYGEAATAYDTATRLGLPQRMLLYQFGPFFAYFHTLRTQDLLAVSEYVLNLPSRPVSEEPLLWHGWALYRMGDTPGAIADWNAALEANPNYQDAIYALDWARANP